MDRQPSPDRVATSDRPRLARHVRLTLLPRRGSRHVLLAPRDGRRAQRQRRGHPRAVRRAAHRRRDRGRAAARATDRPRRRGARVPRPGSPPGTAWRLSRWIAPSACWPSSPTAARWPARTARTRSNMADYGDELTTAEWRRVLVEARELGVLQCHLSGGEPLLRRDLVEIVARGPRPRPLHQPRHQRARALPADGRAAAGRRPRPRAGQHPGRRAGRVRPDRRHPVLPRARSRPAAWSRSWAGRSPLNVVLHRQNIDRVAAVLRLAEEVGRRPGRAGQHPVLRLGLAQPRRAAAEPGPARARPRSSCAPPASGCGTAWTSSTSSPTTTAATRSPAWAAGPHRQLTVTPNGDVLPCPAAQSLPLPRASVRDGPAGPDLGRVAAS